MIIFRYQLLPLLPTTHIMSSSPPLIPWPINSELPTELAFLANHISNYFNAKAPYNNASLGALIFTPPPQRPRLLLVQNSTKFDPHAFSTTWEVPTGAPVHSDMTLLHALDRIIMAQTGLRLNRIHSMTGSEVGPDPQTFGDLQWMKLLFAVEVAETEPAIKTGEDPAWRSPSPGPKLEKGKDIALESISVTLNPEKHQLFAWVSEDDLQEFIKSDLFPREETKQYEMMLDAFALHRQSIEQLGPRTPATVSTEDELPPPLAGVRSPSQSPAPTRSSTPKPKQPRPTRSLTPLPQARRKRSRTPSKGAPAASYFHRFSIR